MIPHRPPLDLSMSAHRLLSRGGRVLLAAFLFGKAAVAGVQPSLLDDRAITVRTERDVSAKRKALIRYLWGEAGFPASRYPNKMLANVKPPVQHLTGLARVDEFRVALAPGLEGLAYHFIPGKPNGSLVVAHQGHTCTLDDDPAPGDSSYGVRRTIQNLLREGYGVLGVFMPRKRPGDCLPGGHESLFRQRTAGSPMKWFLEPTAASLNYLQKEGGRGRLPRYGAFHMVGLSGGGWTATVYAAVDPRIRYSVPVAGSIPLYLRAGASTGDREQFEPGFYRLAGYPDLYVLGSHGKGRRQIQVLVRRDDCCFGERQHNAKSLGQPYEAAMRGYEARVKKAVSAIGGGSFRLAIDDVAPAHMVSQHAISTVLLPELRSAR